MSQGQGHGGPLLLRFDRSDRIIHGFLMVSFLTLALTGTPLLFGTERWAQGFARLLGGFKAAALIHRLAAIVLIATFLTHLTRVLRRLFVKKEYSILWGPASLVPQPRDITEFIGHLKYFLGRGPRPKFDHFTYWEKFDYWAVFWGMAIIGGSGFMLWFPKLFSLFVPGWAFNLALLIHGEEAILAFCFIFTAHFFNGHLRPEKFPMDPVIFSGRIPLEEMEAERQGELERLGPDGIARLTVGPESPLIVNLGRLVGTVAVVLGLTVVMLAITAFLTH